MIEDVDEADELTYSDLFKASAVIFDKIDNGKDGVFPYSKFFDLIEKLGEVFHSEELAGHLQKGYPNECGSLERFYFVRLYVDEEVSLDSTQEVERLVGWDCKVNLIDLQREIFLMIHSLKRER